MADSMCGYCVATEHRACTGGGCSCDCNRNRRSEAVDHPSHYGGADNPYEHIKVADAWELNYRLGNATKYICRAGKKGGTRAKQIEDLKKAAWYVQSEIQRLESEQSS